MKLIIGLGNPGEKYRDTRHNIGAKVVKALAGKNAINLRRKKYFSSFGEGKIGDETVQLILPMTYMNLSGEAVISIVKDKGIALSDILVVCDDADLEFGSIRMRPFGSDGGHKGLRSIIERVGTASFARLRIGIGSARGWSPPQGVGGHGASGGKSRVLKDYVLRPFNRDEAKKIVKVQEKALLAVLCWIKDGIDKAMNKYNANSPK
ncbi:MAG: aminoacyl-tRNA hydrolase [Candidatus Omnitrophica bacterium]|nr:aminoacyl-tRNA hydrolase [Candidatus Omnitrophota bacterium]MBU4488230.1 aminoacyl-tRNA hydrolase [Candidatus Omnitrophota bacterium]MCG2704678.1 aminoacyl-tRNA hydrolase [Candidatus Omnitrophota bacterium]